MDSWLETKQFPMHFIATGGLVYKDNQVLLIRSKRRGWEFPGGVLEQGEAILEGLKREIWEESGIIARPVTFVGVYQNLAVKNGYGALEGMKLPPVVNMDFICTYESGTARVSEESVEVAWVRPEEAKSMVRRPILAKRLANMLAMKRKISFATFEKPDNQIDNFQQLFLNES